MECKNCHSAITGPYCSDCGQSVKDHNRPFRFVIYDFAGSIFAYDTRLLNSLRALMLSPGKLSRHFAEGKRARYMPPFQLYVFVSFVFFLTLSFVTQDAIKDINMPITVADSTGIADVNEILTRMPDSITANIDLATGEVTSGTGDDENGININFSGSDNTVFNQKAIKQVSRLLKNPDQFFSAYLKYFSWGLFILMPVFALLLLLLFRNKDLYYTAHLTFSLNLHTFLFLLIWINLILSALFSGLPGWITTVFILLFLFYEYKGLRRMYSQKRRTTTFKLILVNVLYGMVFLVSGMMVFLVTLMVF